MPTAYPDGSYITKKGNALIAKLLASKGPLTFTRATVGTGELPDDTAPEDMTDLTQYKKDGYIAAIDNPENGEASVVVQVFSTGLAVGFSATQLILWADDPDEGEIAHTFLYLASEPEWIRPQNAPVQKLASFTLNVIVSSVPIVNATINPLALARAIDLADHKSEIVASEKGVHGVRHYEDWLQLWDGEEWFNILKCPKPGPTPPSNFTVSNGVLSNTAPYGEVTPNADANTLTFNDGYATVSGETANLI